MYAATVRYPVVDTVQDIDQSLWNPFGTTSCSLLTNEPFVESMNLSAQATKFSCKQLLQDLGTYPLLAKLASEALLPKNQSREERYFHLAQLLLAEPEQSTKSPCDWDVIADLVQSHDSICGPAFVPAESDYGPVPFISWVHLDDRYYRVPTGTYHWSELFLQDVVNKLAALDDVADEKLDATCSNLLQFFLPKIHRFLFDADLKQVDFLNVRDSTDQDSSRTRDQVLAAWERNLVFERNSLPKAIIAVFDRIAVSPGDSRLHVSVPATTPLPERL